MALGRETKPNAPFGVSHSLEQMLFRGTESKDARQISESFDSLGISYDSSAGIEMTLVSAVLIGNRLSPALDLLVDCLRQPSFPEDEVESVRSLQLQEIRQREDRPAQKVMDALRRQFFRDNPIANDVLGSEDTVGGLTRDAIADYWRNRYTAGNIVISLAGNFDWECHDPAIASTHRRLAGSWRTIGTRCPCATLRHLRAAQGFQPGKPRIRLRRRPGGRSRVLYGCARRAGARGKFALPPLPGSARETRFGVRRASPLRRYGARRD